MKKKIVCIGILLAIVVALIIAVCFFVLGGDEKADPKAKENTRKEAAYTVTFDANGVDAGNLPKPQKIKMGDYVSEPNEPTHEDYFFIGWHTSADAVALVDTPIAFEEYSVEKDTTLYAIWESKAIDIDSDGLNYREEEQHGTDAFVLDTDFDGLSDGDEVNVHKTDPLNPDSDNDGISDGVEISLELNPLSAKSDNVTEDINRKIEVQLQDDDQLFDLKICATPAMLSSISTETFPVNLLENTEGIVSPIIQVEYDKTKAFDSAELTFDYSGVDLTGIDEDDLTFLYLNEETGLYELVPSTVNKQEKTICCEPTHFSKYVVGVRTIVSSLIWNYLKSDIAYSGDMIKVSKVVTTDFDVLQHGFAFHNFQYKKIDNGGFCYGFSMVTYLNYVGKLPLSGEKYFNLVLSHDGYDISGENRFKANQLYVEDERNMFSTENDYDLENVNYSPTLQCITYWFGKQHNIRDQFFDNLAYVDEFTKLRNKLANDEPVPISLWRFGDAGHSVLACGLYQSETDSNVYYISIYDSNYPGEMRYIKLTRGGPLRGTNKLEYGKYTNFQMSNFDIPEGPYVPHKFDVSGTVVNGTKAIAGAKVTITNDKHTASVYTDSKGAFKFAGVPNGVYTVEISAEGYADKKMDNSLTVSGKNVDLGNVELTPKDTAKRLTQVDVKDANGNLMERSQYHYDGDRLIGISYQSNRYEYQSNTVLTYDEAGTLRLMTSEDIGGPGGSEYIFNSAGQLISSDEWSDSRYTVEYEYDEQGNLIREIQDEGEAGSEKRTIEYLYNEGGELTSAIMTTEYTNWGGPADKTTILTFSYSHDSQGRLTEETSKDDVSERITTYSYEYRPFVLSEYEAIGEYNYKYTSLILQNDKGFGLDSFRFDTPEIYKDASGYVAKVVDQDERVGMLTYTFYYDGVAAEAVDGNVHGGPNFDDGKVANNGGLAICDAGKLYYWNFQSDVDKRTYSLIAEDLLDGTTKTVYSGTTRSEIYLLNNCIYFNELDDSFSDCWVVRIDLLTMENTKINDLNIVGLDEMSETLVMYSSNNNIARGYYIFNTQTCGIKKLVADLDWAECLAVGDGVAYFAVSTDDYAGEVLVQCDLETATGEELVEVRGERRGCDIIFFQETDEAIYISYGVIAGTGDYYQDGTGGLIQIDKGNKQKKLLTVDIGGEVPDEGMLVYDGPAFYAFHSGGKEYVMYYDNRGAPTLMEVASGHITTTDMPFGLLGDPFSTLSLDEGTKFWMYQFPDGKVKQILPEFESNVTRIDNWERYVDNINYTGQKVFYDMVYEKENPNPASWRDYTIEYRRELYVFDSVTGETRLLSSIEYS